MLFAAVHEISLPLAGIETAWRRPLHVLGEVLQVREILPQVPSVRLRAGENATFGKRYLNTASGRAFANKRLRQLSIIRQSALSRYSRTGEMVPTAPPAPACCCRASPRARIQRPPFAPAASLGAHPPRPADWVS